MLIAARCMMSKIPKALKKKEENFNPEQFLTHKVWSIQIYSFHKNVSFLKMCLNFGNSNQTHHTEPFSFAIWSKSILTNQYCIDGRFFHCRSCENNQGDDVTNDSQNTNCGQNWTIHHISKVLSSLWTKEIRVTFCFAFTSVSVRCAVTHLLSSREY